MNKETTPQEQSILGIEDRAKLAYQKHSTKDDRLSLDEQIQRNGGFNIGFKEGANEMLLIIKELKETLELVKSSIPQYEYGQGERFETDTYTKIQTTLDKYKQYL